MTQSEMPLCVQRKVVGAKIKKMGWGNYFIPQFNICDMFEQKDFMSTLPHLCGWNKQLYQIYIYAIVP